MWISWQIFLDLIREENKWRESREKCLTSCDISLIIYKISGRVSSTCVPLSLNRFYVLQDKMKKDENGVGKEVWNLGII